MAGESRKILVVDDEPYILKSISFVLKREDYEVIEANNGEAALAAIREHHPGLVFLDVMMPRMSGYEVVRRVREEEGIRETILVLLTARGQDSDREEGLEAGADDFMTKPFSPAKILEKVRETIG
jgi:DNA-binding response OmpR family regulator